MKSAAKLAKEYTWIRKSGPKMYKAVIAVDHHAFSFSNPVSKSTARWFCSIMGQMLKRMIEKEQEIAPVRKPRVKKTDDEWKMIPVEVRSKPRVFGMNALIIQAKKQSKTWKFNDRRTN
jgi:hypothetical protein